MLRKKREIQNTDLQNGSDILIGIAWLQAVKVPAEIAQGTFYPVMLIDDLQFQIQDSMIIQEDFDVQNKCLVRDRSAQFDRIGDLRGTHLLR